MQILTDKAPEISHLLGWPFLLAKITVNFIIKLTISNFKINL